MKVCCVCVFTKVSHTINLSTLGESGYRFGATYVGSKQMGPAESFPVMVGDMDHTGSLNAQIIHQLTTGVRSKIAIQVRGDGGGGIISYVDS